MQNRGVFNAVPQTSPGNSNSSSQPSPVTQPDSSPHLPQSGIGMRPSSEPPVGALQAVQQGQAAAARQTAARMVAASSYGEVNPVIPLVANTGLRTAIQQMHEPIPQTVSGVSKHMLNVGNIACLEASGYSQNSQPHQNPQPQPAPELGVREQAHIIGPGSIPNFIGNSSMGPLQVIPNSEPTLGGMQSHTQIAWQQILQVLTSPNTAEKQQKTLDILKSNPELIPMINQKNIGYQKQQQLRQQMLINKTQAVQQVQAAAARQTAHMVAASSYGKVNPVVIPPVTNTGLRTAIQQMEEPIPQTVSSVSNDMLNVGNVACLEASGYAPNSQSRQNPQPQPAPELGVREEVHIIGPGNIPISIGNSSMGPPQVIPNSEPTLGGIQRQTHIAWQQVLKILKSPTTPEKQQKALDILKSNPELSAMFIRQKTTGYQKQQQVQQQMLINTENIITPSPLIVWHEQQQQHFLDMEQQQPNQLPHPQPSMYSKRPRMENPYEFL